MDNILSKALREFTTGPLNQLLVNMGGKDGDRVEAELSKFNRREPCWSESPNGILMPDDNVAKTMDAVARLSAKGYLDTSFDDRAVHPLIIRSLPKKQAFDRYRKSGDGNTRVWDELEQHMPYQKPKAQLLLVMNMKFRCAIESDDALGEMEELDVQPFLGEWLIQYGCAYPDHQKKNPLIALGTQFDVVGAPRAPVLGVNDDGERSLSAELLGDSWVDWYRFLVVRKGLVL